MTDLKAWEERISTGEAVGKDPRKMSTDELKGLGHHPMSPLEAIRRRCLDCVGGSVSEVRYCTDRKCPSWPFRMKSSPWREKRLLTEEQKARLRENLSGANAKRRVVIKPQE